MREASPYLVPRLLKINDAINYLGGGMSAATFMKVVAPHVPRVILSPRNQGWLREDLDAFLDRRAGKPDASEAAHQPAKFLDSILAS